MKKLTLLVILSLFTTACIHGQANLAGAVAGPPQATYINTIRVQDLPSIVPSPQSPDQRHFVGGFIVKDGSTSTDCAVGGSNHVVLCISNGTTYTGSPFGGGAGGGATIDNTTNVIVGDGAGNGVDSGVAASNVLTKTGNLGGLSSVSAARTALGLGTAATQPSTAFDASGAAATATATAAQKASNLSDLANAGTARGNLGLGAAAQLALSTTIANPGVDTKVASEKAVRDLFNTASGGITVDPDMGLILTGSVLSIDQDLIPFFTASQIWTALQTMSVGLAFEEDATCGTASTPSCFYFDPTSHAPKYTDNAGVAHDFAGSVKSWVKGTSTATSITGSGTATDLAFNVNSADNIGSKITHSTTVNPERFIAASPVYVHGSCSIDATMASTDAAIEVTWHHGSTDELLPQFVLTGVTRLAVAPPFDVHLGTGDYLKCSVFSSTNLTIGVATSFYMIVAEN